MLDIRMQRNAMVEHILWDKKKYTIKTPKLIPTSFLHEFLLSNIAKRTSDM